MPTPMQTTSLFLVFEGETPHAFEGSFHFQLPARARVAAFLCKAHCDSDVCAYVIMITRETKEHL